jgi:formylmethanofuran dehydrogenase subunit A
VLLIKGGEVYDPINRINGETMDIYISNGRVVKAPDINPSDSEIIDASGKIISQGVLISTAIFLAPRQMQAENSVLKTAEGF